MKKGDLFIFGVVFFLFVVLLVIFFIPQKTTNEIGVFFLGKQIDSFSYNDHDKIKITFTTENENIIYQKTLNGKLIKRKHFLLNKKIENTIILEDGVVKMVSSNCPHHDCQKIRLSDKQKTPIICTNNIVIKFLKVKLEDIEVITR